MRKTNIILQNKKQEAHDIQSWEPISLIFILFGMFIFLLVAVIFGTVSLIIGGLEILAVIFITSFIILSIIILVMQLKLFVFE